MKTINTQQTDAETYKAGLPSNGSGVKWTIKSFSTYVNLLYPHITVVPGQEWTTNKAIYKFYCAYHGEYSAQANHMLELKLSSQCRGCESDRNTASAGTVRRRPSTPEERQLAKELHDGGMSYNAISRQLGRSNSVINTWLKPVSREKNIASCKKWHLENAERKKITNRRYYSEFEHGRANGNAQNAINRLRKQNTPETIFLDGEWQEVDRKLTWKIFGEYLLPAIERKEIQELYLECQYQIEKTGVDHHIDHIFPLSVGGEHLMVNLQILPASENLSKNNTFSEADQLLFLQRINFI